MKSQLGEHQQESQQSWKKGEKKNRVPRPRQLVSSGCFSYHWSLGKVCVKPRVGCKKSLTTQQHIV